MINNKLSHRYRVTPEKTVRLDHWDLAETHFFKKHKGSAEKMLAELQGRLQNLQKVLYAEHRHKILIILQGMDTAGKDSTVRFVFDGVNPQGVIVHSFKVPTQEELDHDYLWRVHQKVPARGEIVIFNRSHYEDVLTVAVHDLVPKKIWQKRYHQIREFERLLQEEGTTILKFFLHISKAEQKKRLEERVHAPHKQWKFTESDLRERKLWGKYIHAYEQALSKTSTPQAPWYIVPADAKGYRNIVIASIIVETLESLRMKYPSPVINLKHLLVR